MRPRLEIPAVASALFACVLLAGVLVACGLTVEGGLPTVDDDGGGTGIMPSTDDGGVPAAACSQPSDCPDPLNDCMVPTCDGTTCGTSNVPVETVCTSGGGRVCDGHGKCGACGIPDDCAVRLSACTQNTCTSSTCGSVNSPKGFACSDNGGRLCDGSGTCVACNVPSDCPAQGTVYKTNTCVSNACDTTDAPKSTPCMDNNGDVCNGVGACVPASCTNGNKDGTETDIDCGGACGATCKDTAPQQHCVVGGDCISGVCKTGLCQPPVCNDGVKNGNETDVDCGGAGFNGKPACAQCADQKHCAKNTDCLHNTCFGSGPGTCVSCTDAMKDGNETDTDCGGPACDAQGKTCAVNKGCKTAADCVSGFCSAGGTCQLRPDGTACATNAQCLHNACLGIAGGGKVCCNTGCMDQGANSCGTNGQCKPSGAACADYASGTKCGTPTCSGSTLTPNVCNGTGACKPTTSSTCGGHLDCNAGGTGCLAGCGANSSAGDANCTGGYWCDGSGKGSCQPPQASGASCNRGAQCQSNNCNPGHSACK